jgi:hypothetical protein
VGASAEDGAETRLDTGVDVDAGAVAGDRAEAFSVERGRRLNSRPYFAGLASSGAGTSSRALRPVVQPRRVRIVA